MQLRPLIGMIRVHIVLGGLLAFSLGTLLAVAEGGTFDIGRFALGYLVVLFGDLSTHFSNSFFDVEVDKFAEQKRLFSSNRILVDNPTLRSLAISVSVSLLLLSNFLAVGLMLLLSFPIDFLVVILVASLLGWFYSAPPLRLVSRGLGEVVIAWVTGFAIPGLGYLTARGKFDPMFLFFALAFMMYGLMLGLSLEAPDAEVDRKGMKKTFAVRKGVNAIILLNLGLAIAATMVFFGCFWLFPSSVVNVGFAGAFSFAPLSAAVIAFVGASWKTRVNDLSTLNVIALFVFNALMVVYLLTIVQFA